MISLKEYTALLRLIEVDIKDSDPTTAHNLARELSVIYIKCAYGVSQPNLLDRLGSMVTYIQKSAPNEGDLVVALLLDIISKIKNAA